MTISLEGGWGSGVKGKLEIHIINMSLQGLVRHTVHNGHYSNKISLSSIRKNIQLINYTTHDLTH